MNCEATRRGSTARCRTASNQARMNCETAGVNGSPTSKESESSKNELRVVALNEAEGTVDYGIKQEWIARAPTGWDQEAGERGRIKQEWIASRRR